MQVPGGRAVRNHRDRQVGRVGGKVLDLDELSKVSFADAAGIALLKELRSRGADLIRPTPFLAEQLKDWPSFDAA